MAEGMESMSEAVAGATVSRSAAPVAGGSGQHGGECLNCGTALLGDYCHACGQQGHVHRTLGAFWHDIAHSVLHFDGKIWRTLPLLAWRPGDLTRRYIAGERARFVSPMALFLFSVFLMFAVVSAFGGPFQMESTRAADEAETAGTHQMEQAEAKAELAQLKAELNQAKKAGEDTSGIQSEIEGVQRSMKLEQRAYDVAQRLEKGEAAPDLNITSRIGWAPIDAAIEKAEKNPTLLLYKLQSSAYKFSWALIPISVPFLWLLFLHRRRYRRYSVYDHVVFVTYSIAFMSIGFIVLSLLRPLGGEAFGGIAIALVPPIHIYRQLRGAYELSRWSAVWRTFALILFAFIAAGLFFTLLLGIGVLG